MLTLHKQHCINSHNFHFSPSQHQIQHTTITTKIQLLKAAAFALLQVVRGEYANVDTAVGDKVSVSRIILC